MRPKPRNIALIGFMGSGKTTAGAALAARLGWELVDTDALVEAESGRGIPDLFAAEGETAFREREERAVAAACSRAGRVIATGGGAVTRPANVAALRESSLVVWLTARPDVVVARTAERAADRPLLAAGGDDLYAHVLRMLGERGPLYRAAADVVVDSSDRAPAAVAAEIARRFDRAVRDDGGATGDA